MSLEDPIRNTPERSSGERFHRCARQVIESHAPLLLDQPEDDLDSRFVFEAIVPYMREEKRRRHSIFSTDNANIPVLVDAELILGLSALRDASEERARIRPNMSARSTRGQCASRSMSCSRAVKKPSSVVAGKTDSEAGA